MPFSAELFHTDREDLRVGQIWTVPPIMSSRGFFLFKLEPKTDSLLLIFDFGR
jgi:hypothetical protein